MFIYDLSMFIRESTISILDIQIEIHYLFKMEPELKNEEH